MNSLYWTTRNARYAFFIMLAFSLGLGGILGACQSTKSKQESSDSVSTPETVSQEKLWEQAVQEGWLSDTVVQATYSSGDLQSSKEKLKVNARTRLIWLLLLNDYDLSREDREIAKDLATSKTFNSFGEERFLKRRNGDRIEGLVRRTGDKLRSQWKEIKSKLEKRYPRLRSARR